MKNVALISKIVVVLAIVLTTGRLMAQPKDLKINVDKNWNVLSNDRLKIIVYDSDIKFSTWEKNEVKISGEIILEGISTEDFKTLSTAYAELIDKSSGTNIDTRLIESSKRSDLFGTKTKIELYNGEKITVGKIKVNYQLWMPATMSLNLSSKYNNIKIDNLKGDVNLELYNCDVDMGDFGDKSHFDAKYSTINAGNGKDSKFELYDTKFTTGDLNKVIIDSKYTKFSSKSINLLALESYNDTYTIDNLNGIDIDAKYTTLKAKGNSNLGKFKLYNCTIDVENFNKIEYDSKYTEFSADKVGTLDIKTSYNDTYDIKEVNDLSCDDSKYNKMSIDVVKTSISLPSVYDSAIKIDKVSAGFTSFKGDFKYGSVDITTDPALNYKLNCESTYGEINYPKERFKNKPQVYIEKDTKTQLEISTDPNATCEFNFTSYDLKFTIE